MLLKLFGQLGGRKWLTTILISVLVPILSVYLPVATATTVVTAVAGVAASFILGQAYADGQSKGATSTTAVLKDMQKKK